MKVPTMKTHKFINDDLDFDVNNPYILIEEEFISMLDERVDATDNEPIEEN
jgi:hypothetical protein